MVDLRRPGWKKISPSPRHLVLRHGQRQLRKLPSPDTPIAEVKLLPGQERLFSSYVPGLEAGLHHIDVEQDMVADGQSMKQTTSHLFNVIGPRFALPDGALDSFYPPQGHADSAEVVPHMVFNDPTLPWERPASSVSGPDDATNTVPWLAVLLFTQDELRLGSSELSTMFAETSLGTNVKQSQTLAINMLASEIPKVQNASSAVVYDPDVDGADAKTDLVFLPSALFNPLFTHYDAQGKGVPGQKNGWVHPHRFLAHVRDIHLDGTATAATTDDETHAYSVVVCHRTGPLDITQPTTVVAHLVNIEGVEAMGWPVTQRHVAMSSLYSWDYTCLPPSSFSVADAFGQLGTSVNSLGPRLTQDDVDALQKAGAVGCRLASRIHDGFSMVRYRLQTGEVSSAFFRGPFTPGVVSFPDTTEKAPWPGTSNTGAKLQILDQEYNLMDVTYSAAWNLGKTLALADQTIATALSRVRTEIFDQAMKEAQQAAVKTWAADLGIPSPYRTREDVISSIAATVDKVRKLPKSGLLEHDPNGMVHRWFRPELPKLDLTYKGSEIDASIDPFLDSAAALVASTTDGKASNDESTPAAPYNEFNTPYSPDWAVVLKWVMDRYFLVNVPPHYLISDPSHLPGESVRFFNVDSAWVWAMVDGGLSLANHLDRSDDRFRNAIKGAINTYLTTPIPGLGYVPPVPTYGLLVRSALITKFPDMVVDLKGKDKTDTTTGPPEILRHQVLGQDTLLGLLRAAPEDPDFTSLLLREPPHQQYFSAAKEITPQTIEMDYQRVYTDDKADDPDSQKPIPYSDTRSDTSNPRGVNFIWGTTPTATMPTATMPTATDVRILNMENYASDVQLQLVDLFKPHPTWYTEPYPSAALMGIELNAPCWQLEVQLPYQDPPAAAAVAAAVAALAAAPARATPLTAAGGGRGGPATAPTGPPPQHAGVQPSIGCAPHPPFGQRNRAIPLRGGIDPAPHVRLPQITAPPGPSTRRGGTTTTQSPPSSSEEDDAPPQFTYLVYPVSAAAARQSRVPVLPNNTKQDLVFSIVLLTPPPPNTGPQDFQLQSLTFSVPLLGGCPAAEPQQPAPPLLIKDKKNGSYLGGVRMLSNMRFNVVAEVAADGSTLMLTVLPRAVKGWWPVGEIGDSSGDVSLLLSGVVVQDYSSETRIEIGVTESYHVPHREYREILAVDVVPSWY
ncbi:hypothetical protein C8A00DRAFT_15188 [Chaetomidium leptoderma]|uniref:Uncharacterized protein n=1 Tax=Chaetomidium leptoderma TaxID=669021 RepID=A0AAN6VLR0_9PEZI|nr:hypothetical protein C8A00DRAFT_15188 [Chaetomidium leptoderma]